MGVLSEGRRLLCVAGTPLLARDGAILSVAALPFSLVSACLLLCFLFSLPGVAADPPALACFLILCECQKQTLESE